MLSKLRYSGLKIFFHQVSFLGSSNSRRYHWVLKLIAEIYKLEVLKQKCVWRFYYFNIERNYDVLNSKSLCILLKENMKKKLKTKPETESKTENPTRSFTRQNLCFNSYKKRKLKVKLWWVGARERKKRASFFNSL